MVLFVLSDRRLRSRRGECPNLEVLAFQKPVQRFFQPRFHDPKHIRQNLRPRYLRIFFSFLQCRSDGNLSSLPHRLHSGTVLGVRRWIPPFIEANPRNLGDIFNGSLKCPGSGLIAKQATFTSITETLRKRALFPFQSSTPRACTTTRRASQLRVGPFLPSSPRLLAFKRRRRAPCEAQGVGILAWKGSSCSWHPWRRNSDEELEI